MDIFLGSWPGLEGDSSDDYLVVDCSEGSTDEWPDPEDPL